MPINSVMLAAIKALSYSDEYLVKDYRRERRLDEWRRPRLQSPFYKSWDRTIMRDGYMIPVRVFMPPEEGTYPLIIYFHGGGFVKGNIDTYSHVCMNLARETEHIVLSVDYRLAPEYPFPEGLLDCYQVVQEVLNNAGVFGISTEDVTLMGDSAGANLAAAVSLRARDLGEFKVNRQVLMYPLTYSDHSDTAKFASIRENGTDYLLTNKRIRAFVDLYIQKEEDYNNPYFATLLAKDFSDQPDTLILTAEFDPLRDEGEAYGQCLLEAGNYVEVCRMPGAIHGFISLPLVFDTVKESFDIINRFLNRR